MLTYANVLAHDVGVSELDVLLDICWILDTAIATDVSVDIVVTTIRFDARRRDKSKR